MGSLKFGSGTLRNAGALLVAAVCFFFLSEKLDDLEGAALLASVTDVEAWQWAGALAATALSFAVIGQYDALFHGWLKTGVSQRRAFLSGASAIAVAQTVGFGLATGTLARWRLLPDLSTAQALRLTSYVSFSFIAALGVVIAVLLTALPSASYAAAGWIAVPAILAALAYPAVSLWVPNWLPALPPIGLMVRLIGLTALDLLFAALALYILLPEGADIAFAPLLAAYAIALGAGLVSGSPGGLGPFELCLLSLLPGQAPPDLVAAVLAFRLVYYALPACLGVLCMAAPLEPNERPDEHPVRSPTLGAEAMGLSRQDAHRLLPTTDGTLHVAEASQSLVAFGDPDNVVAHTHASLSALTAEATAQAMIPALYKIGSRSAGTARRFGWATMAVSEEAWLDPTTFTLESPSRRQLRRKLRNAVKSDLNVCELPDLPLADMARVSAAWAHANGGERGFSMSRYDPRTVAAQRCFLAYRHGRLVAFASFHVGRNDWALDLMRQTRDAGDGAMHALIVAAIDAARAKGIYRLSLSAMPLARPTRLLATCQNMTGLRQFKLSFAPESRRLYLAAPDRFRLAVAGLDILLRIQKPASAQTFTISAALQKLHGGLTQLTVVNRPRRAHVSPNDETPMNAR